jgi:hypothetical protein
LTEPARAQWVAPKATSFDGVEIKRPPVAGGPIDGGEISLRAQARGGGVVGLSRAQHALLCCAAPGPYDSTLWAVPDRRCTTSAFVCTAPMSERDVPVSATRPGTGGSISLGQPKSLPGNEFRLLRARLIVPQATVAGAPAGSVMAQPVGSYDVDRSLMAEWPGQ